jgi:NO-binding membrane sensor protein with MHYT domain
VPNSLVWFAVLGGSGAWAVQFVANLAFTFAQCDQPVSRWQLPLHGWEIGLSAGAVAVGLAAWATALGVFLRTREFDAVAEEELSGGGSSPPVGRVHFLSIVGLTVNPLALAIIVMTGIGAPLLAVCQQS